MNLFINPRQMHQNSLEAYRFYWDNEKGDSLRFKVYEFIRQNPECILLDICKNLGRKENSISGRITELKAAKLVIECGNMRIGNVSYSKLKARV